MKKGLGGRDNERYVHVAWWEPGWQGMEPPAFMTEFVPKRSEGILFFTSGRRRSIFLMI